MIKSLRSAVVALGCLGVSLVALAPAASARTPKPTGPVVVTNVNIIVRNSRTAWDYPDVIFKATQVMADGTPLCNLKITNTTAVTQRFTRPGSRYGTFVTPTAPYSALMSAGDLYLYIMTPGDLSPLTVNDQLHVSCQA
jgi:hypothetical protein